MAKVIDNLIVTGLSGRIGKQLVVRRRKDGSYVVAAAPPRHTGRVATENQAEYRERFRAAIAHAKVARQDPAVMATAKAHGQNAFNWAVSDYLAKHPKQSS